MVPVLVQAVVLGIAAAMAPLPVVLAITLLETKRPIANSIAFVLGGLLVYVLLALAGGTILVLIEDSLGIRFRVSREADILYAVIGSVFLVIAGVTWRSSRTFTIPARVNRTLETLGPFRAFVLGLLLCSPGFKNIALMLALLASIGAQKLGALHAVLAMCLFFILALLPPSAPVVTYVALPRERADTLTAGWKSWIEEHARAIIALVCAAIGLILVQEGLSGFL